MKYEEIKKNKIQNPKNQKSSLLRTLYFRLQKGFTLIEVMIAIFVVLIGIVGAIALIRQTITFATLFSSRLIASYLAQEGIEIVRNIRDGNWLEGAPSWSDGLSDGDWEVDYNDSSLSTYTSRYLKIDSGFYNYELGTDTKFKRKITIVSDTDAGNPRLKVSVLVEWQQIGKTQQVTSQEYLYNWR